MFDRDIALTSGSCRRFVLLDEGKYISMVDEDAVDANYTEPTFSDEMLRRGHGATQFHSGLLHSWQQRLVCGRRGCREMFDDSCCHGFCDGIDQSF